MGVNYALNGDTCTHMKAVIFAFEDEHKLKYLKNLHA